MEIDLETLLQRESRAAAKLEAAKEDYQKTSYAIREEIGSRLEALRTGAGMTRERMTALIGGSNRNLLMTAERPAAQKQYFGVPRLLEIVEQYKWAIAVAEAMPAPLPLKKRGRPRKEAVPQ